MLQSNRGPHSYTQLSIAINKLYYEIEPNPLYVRFPPNSSVGNLTRKRCAF